MLPSKYAERVKAFEAQLEQLLAQPVVRCEHNLPGRPGLYRIFDPEEPDETIRAGSTTSLQRRIYQNHLMGDQPVSLRMQLVDSGECVDPPAAKQHIKEKLVVQVLPFDKGAMLKLEHFILAVLQPRYSDKKAKKPA